MHLLSLTVKNLGVFRGRHDFDLEPVRLADGICRNLTLISGHNGSGKSTLFQAMALALHGSLALGDRISQQTYNDFLLSRLHRHNEDGTSDVSREAEVTLNFEYIQSGQPLHIEVKREWQLRGQNVLETLHVLGNGEPPDVRPEDYQVWLNGLVPPGVIPLCFFDAERLTALASLEEGHRHLGEALRRLLNLDLVERLQSDLHYYTLGRGSRGRTEQLRKEVLRYQRDVEKLDAELNNLRAEVRALDTQQAELEAALAEQERRLAAEGGTYAARRPALQERLKAVETDINSATEELRELSAHLLPFALVPELCQTLAERLRREAEVRRRRIGGEFWQEQINHLRAALGDNKLWRGLDISNDVRRKLIRRINNLLKKMEAPYAHDEQPIVHHLAEPEQYKLEGWIAQSLDTVPRKAQALGQRLRELKAERHRIEKELERAPDDDVLAPIHEEIKKLESALVDVGRRRAMLDEQIHRLEFQRDEQARQLQRIGEELLLAQRHERQLLLAEQSRLALRAFEDALTRQKIDALERALVEAFNAVCRKECLLRVVRIDPRDFRMRFYGVDGHEMRFRDFSAGERQLFALSLLWALRQVSGRQLPLVIDTPLARLDEVHRWRLLHKYLPSVSNQVVLFVTGAELTTELLAQVNSCLARIYRLEYDEKSGETMVTYDSRPEVQGIVLYRSESPEAISFGTYDEYGQIWTTDPERVNGYGEVKSALLPKEAKRLVLVNPETGEYNWEHIAELEKLTNNRSIARRLRKKARIHKLWREEWTQRLKKAGYDSVAMVGVEGPEEYVLSPSKLIPLNGASPHEKEDSHGD